MIGRLSNDWPPLRRPARYEQRPCNVSRWPLLATDGSVVSLRHDPSMLSSKLHYGILPSTGAATGIREQQMLML